MEDGEDADDDVHLNLGHRGARSRRAGSVAEDADSNPSPASRAGSGGAGQVAGTTELRSRPNSPLVFGMDDEVTIVERQELRDEWTAALKQVHVVLLKLHTTPSASGQLDDRLSRLATITSQLEVFEAGREEAASALRESVHAIGRAANEKRRLWKLLGKSLSAQATLLGQWKLDITKTLRTHKLDPAGMWRLQSGEIQLAASLASALRRATTELSQVWEGVAPMRPVSSVNMTTLCAFLERARSHFHQLSTRVDVLRFLADSPGPEDDGGADSADDDPVQASTPSIRRRAKPARPSLHLAMEGRGAVSHKTGPTDESTHAQVRITVSNFFPGTEEAIDWLLPEMAEYARADVQQDHGEVNVALVGRRDGEPRDAFEAMVSVTGGADPRPAPEIESKLDGAGMRSDSFCQDYVPAALNPIAAHLRARNPGLVFQLLAAPLVAAGFPTTNYDASECWHIKVRFTYPSPSADHFGRITPSASMALHDQFRQAVITADEAVLGTLRQVYAEGLGSTLVHQHGGPHVLAMLIEGRCSGSKALTVLQADGSYVLDEFSHRDTRAIVVTLAESLVVLRRLAQLASTFDSSSPAQLRHCITILMLAGIVPGDASAERARAILLSLHGRGGRFPVSPFALGCHPSDLPGDTGSAGSKRGRAEPTSALRPGMASVTPPVPRGPRGKGVTGGGQFAGRNRNHKQSGNSSALSGDARAIMAQLAQLLPPTSATVGTTATGAAEGGGGRS